jgi:hypothetical protein
LCPCCHRDKTSQEQEAQLRVRVVESSVNLQALRAFVRAPKPRQLVGGVGDRRRTYLVADQRDARLSGLFAMGPIPRFSVLEDIVRYDGRPLRDCDYLWVRLRTADDPDAPPPRAPPGRLPVYTAFELLPWDGWRRYAWHEVEYMMELGFAGPEHVTHMYTARRHFDPEDLKAAVHEACEAIDARRQFKDDDTFKGARLAFQGLLCNNDPYSLEPATSNCEEDVGRAFRKSFREHDGLWDFWAKVETVTSRTLLPLGYRGLAYEREMSLRMIRACERRGLTFGKGWDSVRNDGVRVYAEPCPDLVREVNAECRAKYGFDFDVFRVKPDDKPPPCNPFQLAPLHCPPAPLSEPRVLVDHDGDFEPLAKLIIQNKGGVVKGIPGVGKTHGLMLLCKMLKDLDPARAKGVVPCAYQICTSRRIGARSLYRVLRRPNHIKWLLVDEFSQLPVSVYSELVALKEYGVNVVLFGDSAQLPPINDEYPGVLMEDTACVRDLTNNLTVVLRHNHRCRDHPEHFAFYASVHDDIDGPYAPDYARFPADLRELPDIFVCQCHRTRMRANALVNALQRPQDAHFFAKPSGPVHSNMEPQDMHVWPGLKMIGCRGSRRVVNQLTYTVVSISGDADSGDDDSDGDTDASDEEPPNGRRIKLRSEDGKTIVLDERTFVKSMRLAYAVTCHCVQGLTITDERVWFMDAAGTYTTKRHYLVAISRVRDPRNLGIPTKPQQDQLLSLSRV